MLGIREPLAGVSALTPIRRAKTAAEEVEERLIMAIARGDKSPGERITEAELAAALNVSRVPVREAMQRLQLRGILVEGEHRGLRVLDYSQKRISELYELRLAVERIIFEAVLRDGANKSKLVKVLNLIVSEMATMTSSGDPVALSSIDLEFHRAVAAHSGNVLAAQIWEGLAQHMLIVFCQHWSKATNRAGEVELHKELIRFVREGSVDDLDKILTDHFAHPDSRSGIAP